MTGKKFNQFIIDNQHRDLEAAKIKIERRLNSNNIEVSQILFYFWDKQGMGDYEILSSKKLPIEHSINKSLITHYQNIYDNTKRALIL